MNVGTFLSRSFCLQKNKTTTNVSLLSVVFVSESLKTLASSPKVETLRYIPTGFSAHKDVNFYYIIGQTNE